jgi:hypothetical protein
MSKASQARVTNTGERNSKSHKHFKLKLPVTEPKISVFNMVKQIKRAKRKLTKTVPKIY